MNRSEREEREAQEEGKSDGKVGEEMCVCVGGWVGRWAED